MPAKPTEYGIRVWMAVDTKNGYVSKFAVYDVVMKMATFITGSFFSTIFQNFEAP